MATTEKPKSTDLVASSDYSPEIQALIDAQEGDLAASTGGVTSAPIIKLTQASTVEVKAGDVEGGDFYNTLTSESYGPEIEFIISDFAEGRALSGKGGSYRTAIGQDVIPPNWAEMPGIGEESVGTRFDEHPDAAEKYSDRANSGEIEWGSGPPIATTFNYTGHVVLKDIETDEVTLMPGRITLQRSTKDAHKKISLLKTNLLRGKPFWDITFLLESEEKSSGRNDYFAIKVKKGRNTTQEEKLRATELAVQNRKGEVIDNADRDKSVSSEAAPVSSGKGVSL